MLYKLERQGYVKRIWISSYRITTKGEKLLNEKKS
jgi:DNA-binding PadR family transcriptional regulator